MSLPPFQFFLDEYREPIYRFLIAAVGHDLADDCFQETFVSALRAYPRLRSGSNLRSWIFTIAHRKALDSHRSRSRQPRAAVAPSPSIDPPGGNSDLWEAVRRLPSKQRAAVFHRHVSGLSYKEIGVVLGCSDAAARRNVHEGLKKLKEVLG